MSPKARGGQAQSRGTPLSGCWLNHTAPGAALQLVCVRSCTPWNQHADEQQVHWQDNKQCHETWCTLLEPAQPHQSVALKDTLSRNHSTCFSSGFSACSPLPGTGQPLQGRLSDCKRWTAWDKLTAKICSKKHRCKSAVLTLQIARGRAMAAQAAVTALTHSSTNILRFKQSWEYHPPAGQHISTAGALHCVSFRPGGWRETKFYPTLALTFLLT